MIARIWTARTTPAQAPAYADHLRSRVLPHLRTIPGYRGASLFRRDVEGEADLIVVTRWQSMEAVRAFAGDDPETAVVEDEAAAVLTGYDRRVRHCTIVVDDA
jgi:heme-degrading monooxygenase HmoA